MDDKIRYSDIIEQDDSIRNLVKELENLTSSYSKMVDSVKKDAEILHRALQSASGATSDGRKAIDEAQQATNRLEKAQREYELAVSDTGKQISMLRTLTSDANKDNISDLSNLLKIKKQLKDADIKLVHAQSEENRQLKLYSTQIREANRLAELQARLANSAAGSYNNLAAQYELNKIKLNAMSAEEREAVEVGKKLEKQTFEIYQQMIRLQEVTGNHRLSVGNYKRAWDGLGYSVTQVVRELPAAAVSANTFFLAISNNIPMVIDEINNLKAANAAAIREGKPTVSVVGSIVKALFSWNSILVVVITALSMFGKEIIEWVKNLFVVRDGIVSTKEAMEEMNEAMGKSNDNYGSNLSLYRKLQEQYKQLRTEEEKNTWIKDNELEFRKLNIAVEDITQADSAFIENSKKVIEVLKLRAKAAAAESIATKKYEEALIKEDEYKQKISEGLSAFEISRLNADRKRIFDRILDYNRPGHIYKDRVPELEKELSELTEENVLAKKNEDLKKEFEAANKEAETYIGYMDEYVRKANNLLVEAGIEPHRKDNNSGGSNTETIIEEEREKRSLTDRINKMRLDVTKKYEASITKLEEEEYEKRKKEAIDSANAKIRALEETARKNEEILADEGKKYKQITDEEAQMVVDSQTDIVGTIINIREALNKELTDIEQERMLAELKIVKQTIDLRLRAVKKGTEDEIALKKASIDASKQIAIIENRMKPKSQRLPESDITAFYNSQVSDLDYSEYMRRFGQFQRADLAEKDTGHLTDRQRNLITARQRLQSLELQNMMHQNGAKPMTPEELRENTANIENTNRQIKELESLADTIANRGLQAGILDHLGFNEKEIGAASTYTDTIIGFIGEIFDAEVALAEKSVEASEKRVEAAQKVYEAELEIKKNGYASNVELARKELDAEKKNAEAKQKMLESAQRRKIALDTATQASSLVTASAEIWAAFGAMPPVAIAMLATMWASFAVAKIKAAQVAGMQSEEYGEGGLEFLEGGSHASGNDIDLGATNSRGRRMRAEGGEALAIINRKNTRKYKNILPDVIESFNKGNFEHKYMSAFGSGGDMFTFVNSGIDLSNIEREVRGIREQNEYRYYTTSTGTTVICGKNTKRIIKS
jgi:hypothetical protein